MMTYILYGSLTSPFVRRLRMLLHELNYEFREINLFEAQDATLLNKLNPLNQIPVLTHGEKTIWDSRQIFRYLNGIHHFETLNWEDENLLTGLEGALDSAIALLLMKRSGMNVEENYMYVSRQRDRIESVLDYIKPYLVTDRSKDWYFASMTLYSFLDWAIFRDIVKIEARPELMSFLKTHSQRPAVIKTAIPKG